MSRDQDAPPTITSEAPSLAAPAHNNDIQALSGSPFDIPLELKRDEDVGDLNPDEIVQANPQWGSVAMLASAASFDSVVPSAVAAAYGNLFWNVERNGEFSLSNGGGSLETTFLQMFGILDENGKPKGDADGDGWSDYAEAQERRAEVNREMEEQWNHEEHSFGDVELTGTEWGELSTALSKDTLFRREMVERLIKEKRLSKKDAEAAVDRAARIAALMKIPEAQRSEAEKAELQSYRDLNDPSTNAVLDWSEKSKDSGFERMSSEPVVTGNSRLSVAAGADAFVVESKTAREPASTSASSEERPFPSAPELTEEHRKAVAATEPLDAPRAPVKVASADPKPAANAARDMGGLSV